MIPYPCWVPDASAVKMRNVASCIARVLITATYIDELAVASPAAGRNETGHSPRQSALEPGLHCVRTRCQAHWIRGFAVSGRTWCFAVSGFVVLVRPGGLP